MDQEKLWLRQYVSELEKKVKISEQALHDGEFKFNLVDAIERAVEKEKNILEVKLNEIQLAYDALKSENKSLAEELVSKDLIIENLQSHFQSASTEHSKEKALLTFEVNTLTDKLRIFEVQEENYKQQLKNLHQIFETYAKTHTEINTRTILPIDFLTELLNSKDSTIKNLETRQAALTQRCSELESKYKAEQHEFSERFSSLSPWQKQIVMRILNVDSESSTDSESLLLSFIEEYEKTAPKILEQKRSYENLLFAFETLHSEHEESTKKLKESLEELEMLREQSSKALDLQESNKYLNKQLANVMYSKSSQLNDLDFRSLEELLKKISQSSQLLEKYKLIIEGMQQKILALEARPLIIEEGRIDKTEYQHLEVMYQVQSKALNENKSKIQEYFIEKSNLTQAIDQLKKNETKLKIEVEDLKKKLTESHNRLRADIKPPSEPHESSVVRVIQEYKESAIEDYKSEIERLKKFNSDMYEALKSNKSQLILSHEENKLKLDAILNEKSLLYIELKKLQIKYMNLENELKTQQNSFQDQLKAKNLELSQLDTKEFAAINELYQTREQLASQKSDFQALQEKSAVILEENKLLHNKLQERSNADRTQLNEYLETNNILKYNCDLYEEELKKLRDQNLELEEKLQNKQRELNELSQRASESRDVIHKETVREDEGFYEGKIRQLIGELERKDKQIVRLVALIGCKDNIPEVMSKMVTVLYKVSKSINY